MSERPESLWRNRSYVLYWTARAVSVLGAQVGYVAFPLFAVAVYGDVWRVSLVTVATYAGGGLTSLHAGVVGDLPDRRLTMVTADVGRVALSAGLAASILMGGPPLLLTCVIAFFVGALGTVFAVTAAAALPDVVGVDLLPRALARNESRDFALAVAGPPLGALLFTVAPWAPFAFGAATYALSAAALAAMRLVASTRDGSRREPFAVLVREGLSFVWADRPIRYATMYSTGMGAILTAGTFTIVAALAASGRTTLAGLALACQALAGLLGSLTAERLHAALSGTTILAAQCGMWTASLIVIALADDPVVIAAAVGLPWLPAAAMRLVVNTHTAITTPPPMRARVASVRALGTGVVGPLGPLTAGIIADGAGYPGALGACATASAVIGAGVLIAHRRRPIRFARAVPG